MYPFWGPRTSPATLRSPQMKHFYSWLLTAGSKLSMVLWVSFICTECAIGIIIIMSCHRHDYPWPSVVTSPYRSSPLVNIQGYIPYPPIAAVCMFELVVLLFPVGVHRSTSLLSSSLLLQQCPACLVRLNSIVFVMGGSWPYSWCLWGVATRTCSILLARYRWKNIPIKYK